MAQLEKYLEEENDRLATLNKALADQVAVAIGVYALQARRDCNDSKVLAGWRELQNKAIAVLAELGEIPERKGP